MTGHICKICGRDSLFFVWTSCRRFPKDVYCKKMKYRTKAQIKEVKNGEVVCLWCLQDLKEDK